MKIEIMIKRNTELQFLLSHLLLQTLQIYIHHHTVQVGLYYIIFIYQIISNYSYWNVIFIKCLKGIESSDQYYTKVRLKNRDDQYESQTSNSEYISEMSSLSNGMTVDEFMTVNLENSYKFNRYRY